MLCRLNLCVYNLYYMLQLRKHFVRHWTTMALSMWQPQQNCYNSHYMMSVQRHWSFYHRYKQYKMILVMSQTLYTNQLGNSYMMSPHPGMQYAQFYIYQPHTPPLYYLQYDNIPQK